MATGRAGMEGYVPSLLIGKSERAKYEEMWEQPEYRAIAPGERHVAAFVEQAKPAPGDEVIDFGCGTGRAAVLLNALKLNVTMIDFASNCLDEWVARLCEKYPESLKFVCHDLVRWPYPVKQAKYGFCCDVLEHIPPKDVEKVLWNVVRSARHVFLAISTRPDAGLGGEPLHLTVQPLEWWKEKLEALRCTVKWSEATPDTAFFYVSAFVDSSDLYSAMVLNVQEEEVQQQILANLRLGCAEICPHEEQPDAEIMLLAGGPSLNDYAEEIYDKAKAGMPVVTVNGTYNWCLTHFKDGRSILPAATVVLDAREFNKRFVQPTVPGCKYLLASQCHPETVRAVPHEQVLLWHSGNVSRVREAIDEWCKENDAHRQWFPVYGGSTVVLRAIMLLRMLGFKKLHIYGFDSCLVGDAHHAYEQPENDGRNVVDLIVGGREFRVHAWMWSQAYEFMDLVRVLGDEIEMAVYGDGLIAHLLRTASELPIPPDAKPGQFYIIDETLKELEDGNQCIPPLQRGEEVPADRGAAA